LNLILLQVWDGPGDTDTDGQLSVDALQGGWRYTDPCPVAQAEWSVVELGGRTLFNNTDLLKYGNGRMYHDGLHLENFKTLVFIV
jgi:hypothetical protein